MKTLERPLSINNSHTQGEWEQKTIFSGDGWYEKVTIENGTSICNVTTRNSKQALANARLIAAAPKLLQIAEMYFDTMRSNGNTDSIPFQITLETLNSLKTK